MSVPAHFKAAYSHFNGVWYDKGPPAGKDSTSKEKLYVRQDDLDKEPISAELNIHLIVSKDPIKMVFKTIVSKTNKPEITWEDGYLGQANKPKHPVSLNDLVLDPTTLAERAQALFDKDAKKLHEFLTSNHV